MSPRIFIKTLADYGLVILLWGLGLGSLLLFVVVAASDFINGPNRALLLQTYEQLSRTPGFPGGRAYDLNTFGGFVSFRILGVMPILLAIFGLLMGSLITRGEEERGSLDILLSTPHSRTAVFVEKWLAMLVAISTVNSLIGLILWLGSLIVKSDLAVSAITLTFINISTLAACYGTLAMLIGQLVLTRKSAAGWTGGVLAFTYLVDNLAGLSPDLELLRYFSPLYYYYQSKPLAISVGLNPPSLLLLAVLTLILFFIALLLYLNRDQGSVYPLFATTKPANTTPQTVAKPTNWWLGNPFIFGLHAELPATFVWSLLPITYNAIVLSIFDDIRIEIAELMKTLGIIFPPTNEILVLIPLKVILLIGLVHLMILLAGWTGDETQGRLEMLLSTPQARWKLLLSRLVVMLLCSALLITLCGLVFALLTNYFNIKIDHSKTSATMLSGWLACGLFTTGGLAVAAFKPNLAVTILGIAIAISYLVDFLGESLSLPSWLINLSVLRQFGRPMMIGLDWSILGIITGLSLALLAIALWQFAQRDTLKTT